MPAGRRIGRLVAVVVRGATRRPALTVAVSLLLAAASVAYSLHGLAFVTSPVRLLSPRAGYVVRLQDYLRDFGELNDIVVAVEAPTPDAARAFAARLVDRLGTMRLGARITYRVDPAYFARRGLLFLPLDDLARLRDRLLDHEEFVRAYAARPTLAQLVESLDRQIRNAIVQGLFDLGLGPRGGDPKFLAAVLDLVSSFLDGGTAYASPWSAAFSLGRLDDPDAGYFFSSDRRLLFLFVEQRRQEGDFTDNRTRIEAIRAAIRELARDAPGVRAGVTGGPAISSDEMATAFWDSEIASALAFALTLALLVLAFRRLSPALLLMLTLTVSLAWSVAIVTAVIGHLSIFSVMFISIVIGIGIDYGIYFLFRYEEERAAGEPLVAALVRSGEEAGPGMALGALTAAGTFLALVLTEFQGIREFGVVSGIAILVALLAMITLLPALVVLVDRRRVAGGRPRWASPVGGEPDWLVRALRHRRAVLGASLALAALAVPSALGVGFDDNLLKLQARGVESVVWEERILKSAGRSGLTALASATGLDELERKQAAFAALPSVTRVESVLALLPGRQPEKIALIQQMAPVVAPIRVAPVPPLEPARLRAALQGLQRRLGLAAAEAGAGSPDDGAGVRALHAQTGRLLERLPANGAPALGALQATLAGDFAERLARFRDNLEPRAVALEDLPRELRDRHVGASGRFLLRIHPSVDIWEPGGAERFVGDLRGVDPDVTGPPVTSFEAIRLIRRGYLEGTLYALVLVVAVTAAVLGSMRGTLLALVPLALGLLWTLGLMPPFGLQFNLANVWALPLIVGTAAEYGLNISMRVVQARTTGGHALPRGTLMAVALNGLTTIVGFGCLMVASHRGIFGLGLLLTIGATVSLVASLAVLPVLFYRFAPLPARPRVSE